MENKIIANKIMDESIIPEIMYQVEWPFDNEKVIFNREEIIDKEFSKVVNQFHSGEKIGLAVGSRGINHILEIVKIMIKNIQACDCEVFIIPAMGSHAGATGEGQTEMLSSYNITEKTTGVPILSSMEVVQLGSTPDGVPVYFSKSAQSMDGVVMLNRVKAHTDFHGVHESGIMKQITVGLGKQMGARTVHRRGVEGLSKHMPAIAREVLKTHKIKCGLAIVENKNDDTAILEIVRPEDFEERDKELLKISKKNIPTIPFKNFDVLVLQEMGKNISGTGIDPNVTGRYFIDRGNIDDNYLGIKRIVCLDLTDESHHNALGVGMCDVIPKHFFNKIDLNVTNVNIITTGFLERGFIPIIQADDKSSIYIALFSCGRILDASTAKMVILKNTMSMNKMLVSEALLDEVKKNPKLKIVGKKKLTWSKERNLELSWE